MQCSWVILYNWVILNQSSVNPNQPCWDFEMESFPGGGLPSQDLVWCEACGNCKSHSSMQVFSWILLLHCTEDKGGRSQLHWVWEKWWCTKGDLFHYNVVSKLGKSPAQRNGTTWDQNLDWSKSQMMTRSSFTLAKIWTTQSLDCTWLKPGLPWKLVNSVQTTVVWKRIHAHSILANLWILRVDQLQELGLGVTWGFIV